MLFKLEDIMGYPKTSSQVLKFRELQIPNIKFRELQVPKFQNKKITKNVFSYFNKKHLKYSILLLHAL